MTDAPFTLRALRMLPHDAGSGNQPSLFVRGWPVEFAVFTHTDHQRYGPDAPFGAFQYTWVYSAFCALWKKMSGNGRDQGYTADVSTVYFESEDDAMLCYMHFAKGIVIQ